MKRVIKRLLLAMLVLLFGFIGNIYYNHYQKEQQIEEEFGKWLMTLPIKDLRTLYDLEGRRAYPIKEDDKGEWRFGAILNVSDQPNSIRHDTIYMFFDRNSRMAEGYYSIEKVYFRGEAEEPISEEKKYPLVYEDKGFQLKGQRIDSDVKESFDYLSGLIDETKFDSLKQYKLLDKGGNSAVSSVNREYAIPKDTALVQRILQRYDVRLDETPKLYLSARLDDKEMTLYNQELEVWLGKGNQYPNVQYREWINFGPHY